MQEKILLVDDREDNILSLEAILDVDGYKLVHAFSGREALKVLLHETDFALILMDVKMPGLDGFETASMIYQREKLQNIPIIFITAIDSGDENVYNGYKAGAVDFIHKPINPELLRAKVSVFVELYRKTEKLRAQEKRLISMNISLEQEIAEKRVFEGKILELNKQLMANIAQLEATNKELDSFVFMASHDMQEPLRKIKTFSNLLRSNCESSLDESSQNFISRIHHSADRMQDLIADILSFSKVAGEEFKVEPVNLNLVLEEVVSDFQEVLQTEGGMIEAETLPQVPGNAGLIRSLFYNLIHNSIKYRKKSMPPQIKIYAKNNIVRNLGKTELIPFTNILVQDNGIGFEQKYAEQIFEIFKRLHGSSEFSGTGIGLALCRKIVEKHHGYISAQSQPENGAIFTVSLPLAEHVKTDSEKKHVKDLA